MAQQITIPLPNDLVAELDKLADDTKNRSKFVESFLRKHLAQVSLGKPESNDLRILNKNSDYLNQEAEDVLSYQVSL
ncbi:MAG: ribbon-helix-helix domain-containing protein [bacterium]|nr:ribbon-helix-helix domain-containing protein [bacterium]